MPKKINPRLKERAVRLVREHRAEYVHDGGRRGGGPPKPPAAGVRPRMVAGGGGSL